MINKLVLTLAYISALSLVVAIVDAQPFEPGFRKVQHTNRNCAKGQVYEESTNQCVPKR